jgi:hypothetical protein
MWIIHAKHNKITETMSLQNHSYTVQNGYELVPNRFKVSSVI